MIDTLSNDKETAPGSEKAAKPAKAKTAKRKPATAKTAKARAPTA